MKTKEHECNEKKRYYKHQYKKLKMDEHLIKGGTSLSKENDRLRKRLLELEKEFSIAGEAKAVEAAVNKDGQPSQVGHDLPVAGIIAPLGR